MDTEKLRKYAELIARSGLNILPEQEVVVRTAPEQLEFVEMVVEECYRAGASKVTVEWRYDPFTKLAIKYQEEKTLGRVELWERKQLSERTEKLPANVYLDSDDPDGLCGIDSDKWARAQQMRYRIRKTYLDRMENKYQWCVAAVPGKKWAERVFPNVPTEEAVEKLWEAILKCGRADGKEHVFKFADILHIAIDAEKIVLAELFAFEFFFYGFIVTKYRNVLKFYVAFREYFFRYVSLFF